MRPLAAAVVAPVLLVFALLQGQQPQAATYQPSPQELILLRTQTDELQKLLARVPARTDKDLLADAEVYHKAAVWLLRHPEELYTKEYFSHAERVLARGKERAEQLFQGRAGWIGRKGRIAHAYRSAVDDSVQPYALWLPEGYDPALPARLDVVLHGRDAKLSEVSFLNTHDETKPVPAETRHPQLHVFGRTNNAYRWAGEADVLEALASVQRRYRIDPNRIVLRGFSMGGAGAWHLGTHYPDRWAAVEAGAGFSETQRYTKRPTMPEYQERLLHIYDAQDYALNLLNTPTVGYGGEIDPQLQASRNILAQLEQARFSAKRQTWETRVPGWPVLFLVGSNTAHKWHPDSKAASDRFLDAALAQPRTEPQRVLFRTYTTRYHRSFWVQVDALDQHYQLAEVDARKQDDGSLQVQTRNIAAFTLTPRVAPTQIRIDGQAVKLVAQRPLAFSKQSGQWRNAALPAQPQRKLHSLQGPIDDAFLEPFLCVVPQGGEGEDWRRRYERFRQEYAKFFRADVRTKLDTAVTAEDLRRYHIVAFGSPTNNRLLARAHKRLPVQWQKGTFEMGGKTWETSRYTPAFIVPNPLQPERYLVVNSGHTVHAPDLFGSNALFYPRHGDYAVLPAGEETPALAGVFDEQWRVTPQAKP